MKIVLQYLILLLCGLGLVGLIRHFRTCLRPPRVSNKRILAVLLPVLVLGSVFGGDLYDIVQPAVLSVGMDLSETQALLAQEWATPAYFQLQGNLTAIGDPLDRPRLNSYWLSSRQAIHIVSKKTSTGSVIESIHISTYPPSSWGGKGDFEREKFFQSFVEVKELNLKALWHRPSKQ